MDTHKISTKEQIKIWSYVAAHSFGGPAGQISVIHKIVVDDKKLISEERFLHALNFCMLLPGPEAQQLATYMGWLMNKWRGGIIAGGLFVLPGFTSILLLSYLYVIYNDTPIIQGIFYGMKPAIIPIVIAALYKISTRSLKNSFYWALALCSFIALFFFKVSFPIIVMISGLLGIILRRNKQLNTNNDRSPKPPFHKTLKTFFIWTFIWMIPIFLTLIIYGEDSTFHTLNIFFSKMSMVTFGGAYAALAYVAQKAVEVYGWLRGSEMIDGLAIAETTPGPLIQVVQYVGFMGAFRFPGMLNPYLSAFIGSVLTTWMTFAPCFLWIFTLAPYIEYIRGKKIFSNALQAITACVVGVILNLSLWFAFKALFMESLHIKKYFLDFDYPVWSSLDLYAFGIFIIAFFMQFKLKKSLYMILGTCMILGIIVSYAKSLLTTIS